MWTEIGFDKGGEILRDGIAVPIEEIIELLNERDKYRKTLEIIADRSTACMTYFGTVECLRAHAREAISSKD